MHLYIGKYSGDLTFSHFDAISLAQSGTFQCCNSLEGLTEMGETEMHFKINILQGHACDEGIKQEIILT